MAYAARGFANMTKSTVHEEHFLNLRALAINAVRQELTKVKGPPSDGLIVAVGGLLATEKEMVPTVGSSDTSKQ